MEFSEYFHLELSGLLIQTSVGTEQWFGRLAHEAFGVTLIGGIENGLALFEDARGLAVVNHGWRQQA